MGTIFKQNINSVFIGCQVRLVNTPQRLPEIVLYTPSILQIVVEIALKCGKTEKQRLP